MKERPILFSAPMVRALLAGTKTQTRRVMKPQPTEAKDSDSCVCAYGQPGDRLWVREAFACTLSAPRGAGEQDEVYVYRADLTDEQRADEEAARKAAPGIAKDFSGQRWRPSIHMPRAASRITLEVVAVRVERLQDIGQGDACAEGAPAPHEPIDWYRALWEQINGPGSWAANPWVWVVEFKRVPQ